MNAYKLSIHLFSVVVLAGACFGTARAQSLSGSTAANLGSDLTYSFSSGTNNAGAIWQVSEGATIIPREDSNGPYNFTADVLWKEPGTHTLALIKGGAPVATLDVTVSSTPVTPAAVFTFSYICGATTVTRAIDPPVNTIGWYWQTSATGTSTANNTYSYTVNAPGTYYLRPRYSSTWGTAQPVSDVVVQTTFDAPATAADGYAVSDVAVAIPLSIGAVSGATAYLWYTTAAGGTAIAGQSGATYSPSVTASQTYYVSATNGICESARKAVTAYVYPVPAIAATNEGVLTSTQPVMLSVDNFTYDSYQWLRDGVEIPSATGQIYAASTTGSYRVVGVKSSATGTSAPVAVVTGLDGQNVNYIVSNTVMKRNVTAIAGVQGLDADHKMQVVQYFDGLGRPMQAVSTQASPQNYDLVQPMVYDASGREYRKYLPVIVQTDNGRYKRNILAADGTYAGLAATNAYNNGSTDLVSDDPKPYAETLFEASPLNRVSKQGAPGAAWQPDAGGTYAAPLSTDHSVKKSYETNTDGEVVWLEYDDAAQGIVLGSTAYYAPGQLVTSKTKDEHNREVIEYLDNEGHTVLKKVETEVNGAKAFAETYYVYNDFGTLVLVLPPEATTRIKVLLIP